MVVALIGVILVIIAITAFSFRAVWMFWFLCLYGGLMVLGPLFPFGLFFLIFALAKIRKNFCVPHPALCQSDPGKGEGAGISPDAFIVDRPS